jgi:hypothetical protein
MTVNTISEQLLLAIKSEQDFEQFMAELNQVNLEELQNDDAKKAFWINIYNSFFLILRKVKKVDKSDIYTTKGWEINKY